MKFLSKVVMSRMKSVNPECRLKDCQLRRLNVLSKQ